MISCDMQKDGFVCFETTQHRGESWLKGVLEEVDRINEFMNIDNDLTGLAIACNSSVEEIRLAVVEITSASQVHMCDVVKQLNQAFCPVIELSSAIEEINLLMDSISVDIVESGKKVHSYDKFLPKPIGKQRRKRR